MSRCYFIISDSGDIQEEAPALGKPVLVMRNTTDRPVAVDAGTIKLVGTTTDIIVSAAIALLDNEEQYRRMSIATNPYGIGNACGNIIKDLLA